MKSRKIEKKDRWEPLHQTDGSNTFLSCYACIGKERRYTKENSERTNNHRHYQETKAKTIRVHM